MTLAQSSAYSGIGIDDLKISFDQSTVENPPHFRGDKRPFLVEELLFFVADSSNDCEELVL
jgi:hypothetical protein